MLFKKLELEGVKLKKSGKNYFELPNSLWPKLNSSKLPTGILFDLFDLEPDDENMAYTTLMLMKLQTGKLRVSFGDTACKCCWESKYGIYSWTEAKCRTILEQKETLNIKLGSYDDIGEKIILVYSTILLSDDPLNVIIDSSIDLNLKLNKLTEQKLIESFTTA